MATRKLLGSAAIVAAVAGGGVAGALIGTPLVSSAQEADGGTTTTAPDDGTTTPAPPDGGDACRGGRGHFGHVDLDVAADALGLSVEDLRAALQDGKSLAVHAGEQGVEVQALIDALVADAAADIDEAVAAGDLDADQAEERKANLAERITAMVNGELPLRGPGRPGGPGRGPRFGGGGPAAGDSGSDAGTDSGTSF